MELAWFRLPALRAQEERGRLEAVRGTRAEHTDARQRDHGHSASDWILTSGSLGPKSRPARGAAAGLGRLFQSVGRWLGNDGSVASLPCSFQQVIQTLSKSALVSKVCDVEYTQDWDQRNSPLSRLRSPEQYRGVRGSMLTWDDSGLSSADKPPRRSISIPVERRNGYPSIRSNVNKGVKKRGGGSRSVDVGGSDEGRL